MLRVYLAGKMSGRYAEDVKSERARATNALAKFGIHAVDPAAAESKLWGTHKYAKISTKFRRRVMAAMVWQDLWLIRRCDVLLVLTGDGASEGTNSEWTYAKNIGIPVVLVAPERVKGNLMGWTNILIPDDHTFPSVESAARFINRRYVKAYEKHREYFNAAIKNAVATVNNSVKRRKKKALTKSRKSDKIKRSED